MATTNLGKVSVTPKGEYDPLITYERLDVISHNGSSYIVKQALTGVTPIEGEFYALIAEKGDGGSFVKKAYKTYAAMDADKVNIPANSSVDVTNDPDESKNGAYIYDGVAFTRSQYDSKVVTDKIIADTAIAVQDAINNTAIEGGVLADTFLVVGGSTNQAVANKGLDSISALLGINNPSNKLRLFVKNYHAGGDGGGGEFVYDAAMPKSKHNGGTIIDPDKVYPSNWADLTQKNTWFTADASNTGTGCYKRILTDTISNDFFGAIQYTDATLELNKYFSYIKAEMSVNGNRRFRIINTVGRYQVSETIKCNFLNVKSAYFDLHLFATSPLQIIMALSCQQAIYSGHISVESTVSDPITSESLCDIGIAVQRCISSELPALTAKKCRSWGVLIDSSKALDSIGNNNGAGFLNNSQANLPRVLVDECGRIDKRTFNALNGISGHKATVSNMTKVDPPSVGQRTELTVDVLPPEVLGGDLNLNYVNINSKPYQLMSVDKTNKKIQVFPLVPDLDMETTTVHYIMGGGVLFAGTNSNVITANYIDAYFCTQGVRDYSFYGAIINQYTTHYTILCYGVGSTVSDISPVGAVCESIYVEENKFDLVHVGAGSLRIGSPNGNFGLANSYKLAIQNSSGVSNDGFNRVTIGTDKFYSGRALNNTNGNVVCKPLDGYIHNHYSDSVNLLVFKPDAAQNRLYGSQAMHIMCVGKSTSDGALAEPITVTPYETGDWTVNGAKANYTIPQTTGKPSTVTLVWDWGTKNVKVFVS